MAVIAGLNLGRGRRPGVAPPPGVCTFPAMIEGMAILAVFLIAALIYIAVRLQSQNDRRNPQAEAARLRESVAWHEQRLRTAREKKWDVAMIDQIAEQLADAEYQLARVNAASPAASRQNPWS
jgi:hypothetical protein